MGTSTAPPLQLALQLQSQGRLTEAVGVCRQILKERPGDVDALNTLAILLQFAGEWDEAREVLVEATTAHPGIPEFHYNLGNVLRELGDFDGAIAGYRKALEIRPEFRQALNNLANALKETGDIAGAKEMLERALALGADARVASNLLYLSYFEPGVTAGEIFRRHEAWDRAYARGVGGAGVPYSNAAEAERRVRVGYVSPDFRNHPVGRFLAPLLSHHDRKRFEVFCYSDVRRADSMTGRVRSLVENWRNTGRLSDEELAGLVRKDGIDILVDLTMHMDGNRMMMFARKPAPVQVTYLAYAGTTGLTAMDYRLSDGYLDPPGGDEGVYSEKTLRLKSYWCYSPPVEAPAVAPLPAQDAGYVTFGCLNNFSKINAGVLGAWRRILERVAGSRLILSAHRGSHRERVRRFFAEAGIGPERIEFTGVLSFAEYLGLYGRIDVALDPFPYPGGTTSLDALYMGTPVVTLPGETAVSRAGVSILRSLGLEDLIAGSIERYVEIAVGLAGHRSVLETLRQSLRGRLMASPLTDGRAFALDVEGKLREAWLNECAKATKRIQIA